MPRSAGPAVATERSMMASAMIMGILGAYSGSDVDGVIHRQRSARDPLLERLPRVVRHHDVQLAVGGLVDLVDRADVRVIEGGGGLRLLEEPLFRRSVPRQVWGEHLDRDLTVEARVLGQVDDAHPALAELRADRVRAEREAWSEGHGWTVDVIATVLGPDMSVGVPDRFPRDYDQRLTGATTTGSRKLNTR